MKSITKETFAVATDASGRKFVYEAKTKQTGITMPMTIALTLLLKAH